MTPARALDCDPGAASEWIVFIPIVAHVHVCDDSDMCDANQMKTQGICGLGASLEAYFDFRTGGEVTVQGCGDSDREIKQYFEKYFFSHLVYF